MRFLMCPPTYYGIFYEINPWMNMGRQADSSLAKLQWQNLYSVVKALGATIDLLEPVFGLPDLVFTANVGLWYRERIVLPCFRYPERAKELPYAKAWFQENNFVFANDVQPNTPFFEGAGDALWDGKRLFAGYGFRSDRRFFEETSIFSNQPLIFCELVDPYFYHLDTCFCPLTPELAMVYLPAFSEVSQQRIKDSVRVIEVSYDEAKHFACNAIVLDDAVVIPKDCPALTAQLTREKFSVYEVDVTEFIKAGGACKCLSLRIG